MSYADAKQGAVLVKVSTRDQLPDIALFVRRSITNCAALKKVILPLVLGSGA
jgi:hypothetical protein